MARPLTIADLSILGAVIAYLAPVVVVKYGAIRAFDNARPRDPAFFADPYRSRGLWAHQNGVEGFAFFAAAVIVAQMRGAAQPVVDGLAVAYVLLRLVYAAAYLGDRPSLRSILWGLGMAANIALLLSPAFARA
jgi:uncharacterized MAPEG superfamily protein